MSDPYIGQVILFGGNYAPLGWAFCDGSLLSIAQNTALFSILGTTYGGNGQTTFALPDLRGRAPVHAGASAGPGLSPYVIGETGGVESVTVTTGQLPGHNHGVKVAGHNEGHTQSRPGGNILGDGSNYDSPASADTSLGGVTCGLAGGSQPHENRQPFLACNYIIALEGIYPSRG
ncbi:MAG: phage tail protein [Bryobacterales bacterium]|nr:phage tail protein [Bryobacterales bacterium]